MAVTTKRVGDLTAQQRDAAAKAAAEERDRRADEISLVTAAKKEAVENTVRDATSGRVLSDAEGAISLGAESSLFEIIRVTADVSFVYGPDRYTFAVGQKYRVPRHIADHLEEVGYIWRNA